MKTFWVKYYQDGVEVGKAMSGFDGRAVAAELRHKIPGVTITAIKAVGEGRRVGNHQYTRT